MSLQQSRVQLHPVYVHVRTCIAHLLSPPPRARARAPHARSTHATQTDVGQHTLLLCCCAACLLAQHSVWASLDRARPSLHHAMPPPNCVLAASPCAHAAQPHARVRCMHETAGTHAAYAVPPALLYGGRAVQSGFCARTRAARASRLWCVNRVQSNGSARVQLVACGTHTRRCWQLELVTRAAAAAECGWQSARACGGGAAGVRARAGVDDEEFAFFRLPLRCVPNCELPVWCICIRALLSHACAAACISAPACMHARASGFVHACLSTVAKM